MMYKRAIPIHSKWFWGVGLGTISAFSVHATDALAPLDEAMFFSEIPVVLSATRLKQPLTDSPASVTVIDRAMIDASGAIELVDLLRLVPGFQVGFFTGAKFTVSSHGNADRYARDMQVLIDGRSIYDPAFGGVTWADQALDMDDIQRIEVIRGPNASTHGSNSFSGVINIITQHPSEQNGIRVKTVAGDGGRRQIYNRFAGNEGNLAYRIALKYDENDGFYSRHDSSDTRWLGVRGDYQINSQDALLFEAGTNSGTREDGFLGDPEQPLRAVEENNSFQQLRWTRSLSPGSDFYLQLYHNYQSVDDSFSDAITFFPLDVSLGYGFKSQRYDLEFQHTIDLNSTQRMVWGLGARRDYGKGIWTFKRNDWITRDQYRAFGNLEWRLSESLLLNVGGMYEKFEEKEGFFSPKLALNIKLDEMNTLRMSGTRAYRMPTLWEDFSDQSVVLTSSMASLLQTYKSTTNLRPEYIESFELGYLGNFQDRGLTLDMKVFHEEIKDMIAEVKDLNAPQQPYTYMNSGSLNINGFEIGLRWDPSPKSMLSIGYSLTHAYGRQIKKYPPTQIDHYRILDWRVPPVTASILASHQFDSGIKLSSAYYYMDEISWAGDGDDVPINRRWDIKIAKPFELEKADGEIALILQNIGPDNDFQDFHEENIWEKRIFLEAQLNWH
ncbi:MAG: TonB-dependent receptor [Sedimenticola sp.]|nr:TonB-dependent receptor [Sedimenticola sp.]MCW8882901.1 TonB-dependent receptor [Sedimenticola sp.]